jgi:hypothetical protein
MFVISHKHDDDDDLVATKKGWVAEKWMDRESLYKTKKNCNFILHG